MLFFVLYCSVGVCTSLLSPAPTSTSDINPHSMHGMTSDMSVTMMANHCDTQIESCDWSLNPVTDPVADAAPDTSFFVLYLLISSTFLLSLLLLAKQLGHLILFAQAKDYQRNYPRVHVQNAVFLN